MRRHVLLVVLGIALAAALGGCKKGGRGSAQCGVHVVRSEKADTFRPMASFERLGESRAQEELPDTPPDTIKAMACELSIFSG